LVPIPLILGILEREIWKKNMLTYPDFGKIWSLYNKIGDIYAEFGMFSYSLEFGYLKSHDTCANIHGNNGLRKKCVSLHKIIKTYKSTNDLEKSLGFCDDLISLSDQLRDENRKFKYLAYKEIGSIYLLQYYFRITKGIT
jgi:hypothetical protein